METTEIEIDTIDEAIEWLTNRKGCEVFENEYKWVVYGVFGNGLSFADDEELIEAAREWLSDEEDEEVEGEKPSSLFNIIERRCENGKNN